MLINYLKIAIRNLRRYRFYSAINGDGAVRPNAWRARRLATLDRCCHWLHRRSDYPATRHAVDRVRARLRAIRGVLLRLPGDYGAQTWQDREQLFAVGLRSDRTVANFNHNARRRELAGA